MAIIFNSNKSPEVEPKLCRSFKPHKNWKKYFNIKFIEGEKYYICDWDHCDYLCLTKSKKLIKKHIVLRHTKNKKYKCNESNCNKVFGTFHSLKDHKFNHLCGFGSHDLKDEEICSFFNVKKYLDIKKSNTRYKYECNWNCCGFVSKNIKSIDKHIHDLHICPNRQKSNNLEINNF